MQGKLQGKLKSLIEKKIRRNRLVLVSVIIILIATLSPGNGKIAGNYLDKVAHFTIFLFLSLNLCYKYQKNEKLIEVLFLAILFGLFTEVFQQFIPGRGMDIYDGIADTLGVILAYYFYRNKQLFFDEILFKLGA